MFLKLFSCFLCKVEMFFGVDIFGAKSIFRTKINLIERKKRMTTLISAKERILQYGCKCHIVNRRQYEKGEHYHDFYELVIINGGSCTHWLDGNSYTLSPGDVFLIPPGAKHAYLNPTGLRLTNVLYTVDALEPYQKQLEEIPGFVAMFQTEPNLRNSTSFKARMSLRSKQMEELNQLLLRWEEEFRNPHEAHALLSEIYLVEIIIFCARRFGIHRGKIESYKLLQFSKMEKFINDNFRKDISRDDIMAAAGVSASAGTALFRTYCQQPPMMYLLNVRLACACDMLHSSDKSITEIAFDCGFTDSNYFSMKFHRHLGMTPREYRCKKL